MIKTITIISCFIAIFSFNNLSASENPQVNESAILIDTTPAQLNLLDSADIRARLNGLNAEYEAIRAEAPPPNANGVWFWISALSSYGALGSGCGLLGIAAVGAANKLVTGSSGTAPLGFGLLIIGAGLQLLNIHMEKKNIKALSQHNRLLQGKRDKIVETKTILNLKVATPASD